jgi:hypothetical protein
MLVTLLLLMLLMLMLMLLARKTWIGQYYFGGVVKLLRHGSHDRAAMRD